MGLPRSELLDKPEANGDPTLAALRKNHTSGLWGKLEELTAKAARLVSEIEETPADQVTADQHAEVDRLYEEAAQVRADLDQGRTLERLTAIGGGPAVGRMSDAARQVMGGQAAGWLAHAAGDRALSGAAREWTEETGADVVGNRGVNVPWFGRVNASTTGGWPADLTIQPSYQPIYPMPETMLTLGIMPDTPRYGERQFSWVRPPTAASLAEGGAVAVTDGVADVVDLKPLRVSAATRLTYELSAIRPDAEMALIMALQAAVMDQIEGLILTGDANNDAEPNGIVTAVAATPAADPAAVAGYGDIASLAAGRVDGKLAARTGDVAALVNPATWALGSSLYQASGGPSAISRLGAEARAVGTSTHMPDPAATISLAVIRRGMRTGAYAMPIWPTVQIQIATDPRAGTFGSGMILMIHGLFNFQVAPTAADRADFVVHKLKTA